MPRSAFHIDSYILVLHHGKHDDGAFGIVACVDDLMSVLPHALFTCRAHIWCGQVGYGEHYPGSAAGKVVCSVCMVCGIMVLALPMVIIGSAFEETVKEEERFKRERAKRMEVKLLERFGGKNDVANQV